MTEKAEGWAPYVMEWQGATYQIHYTGDVYLVRPSGMIKAIRHEPTRDRVLREFVRREEGSTLSKAMRELRSFLRSRWV